MFACWLGLSWLIASLESSGSEASNWASVCPATDVWETLLWDVPNAAK